MKNYIGNEIVFAFNIWDINSAKAIIDAAAVLKKNVILQTSVSIYKKVDVSFIRYFITEYAKAKNINAWLHLDHCKDEGIIKDAIDNGYDSIMIDASSMDLQNNIKITNQIAKIAHNKNVVVEAELGQIKGTEDDIECSGETKVRLEEIDTFLSETDADMVAVAFGNAHGIYKGNPKLDYNIVKYVTDRTDRPFVVHGGSGMSDEIIKRLVQIKGVKKINISTDVKVAYREGILNSIENGNFDRDGFQAIKVENDIHNMIEKMAADKMKLLDEVE